MAIKIPVSADFDSSKAEAQLEQFQRELNALSRQVAAANRIKLKPIDNVTVDQMKQMVAQFETLTKLSGDFRRRLSATGQQNVPFTQIDWQKLYPDPHSRARGMARAFQYVTGSHLDVPPANAPRRGPQQGMGGMAVNMVQAGLNATNRVTGGAGGVAANAIGTGMNAGWGAGLMGLLGGMAALGIGKLIGGAAENVGKAEDNFVQLDTLKRQVGDVNVSFVALKEAVQGAANNVKVTFDEAGRLASQFAKLGNVTSDSALSIEAELRTGVGMSRSFGLDPSAGVGFLGTMRGLRMTQDEQGSRRLALLIGETIAKSGAFAKADEVMEAISGYVQTQTRASHTANIGGYAGLFAGMVGSGIPGMDPAGAANIISRINASLMQGGARGEASQFFTSLVGREMGLSPLQTLLFREGGAFATLSGMFGEGSIYHRVTGQTLSGDTSFYQGTFDKLQRAYGGPTEENKLMFANALANHLGIGMGAALALQAIGPGNLGDLERNLQASGVDLKDINFTGLSALTRIMTGTGKDREQIAAELWGRTGSGALSEEERTRLDAAMRGGDEAAQREILTQLVATREQENTQGKDIRDSKALLENIKTIAAEQLIPLTQQMRDGILYMAGAKDGMSPQKIQEKIRETEINASYEPILRAERQRATDAAKSKAGLYLLPGEESWQKMLEQHEVHMDALNRIRELEKERDAKIKEAREEIWRVPERYTERDLMMPEGWRGMDPAAPEGQQLGALPGVEGLEDWQQQNAAAFLNTLGKMEGANYNTLVGHGSFNNVITDLSRHPNIVGLRTADGPSTAAGKYQITNRTWRSLSHGGRVPFTPENQDLAAIELIKRRGAWDDVINGRWAEAAQKLGGEWQSLPTGVSTNQGKRSWSYYFRQLNESLARQASEGTPMPSGASGQAGNDQRFIFDAAPIEIYIRNERGEMLAPSQRINPRLTSNWNLA